MDEVLTVKRKPTVEEIGKHENFDIAKINQIYRFFSKKHPNFFGHKTQA